jgi:hypothetical protein
MSLRKASIVVRRPPAGGNRWEYYAGWNMPLATARWSDSADDAERFLTWTEADEFARRYRGAMALAIADVAGEHRQPEYLT